MKMFYLFLAGMAVIASVIEVLLREPELAIYCMLCAIFNLMLGNYEV